MKKADFSDKEKIIDILYSSFVDNSSINYVVKQDHKKVKRTKLLMEYSFFKGMNFGEVFISNDETACCILLFPHNKKISFNAIWWDIKLCFGCIGVENIFKVLKRERQLKKNHPKSPFVHLWYIGVLPKHQGMGKGSYLAQKIIDSHKSKTIYLETSSKQNLQFYDRLSFKIIKVIEIGYRLYVLKR